ncbi:hypothetical protein LLH23_06400 [bacterium]|nr:hypothetical protein [bacterium]
MRFVRLSWLLLAVPLLSTAGLAADRQALGRTEKLRILVDKVLMASNKWVMTEEHVREIADAGFNVVSPRLGNEDMAEVRRIATAAGKCGIFHMTWMRGVMTAKSKVKMVWADGTEQVIASPNSDELWDWMTDQITNYAKISVECPALIGVFLDYENYWPDSRGNLYDLSFDDKIMNEFAQAKGLTLPQLAFKDRNPWLREHKLLDAFRAFQINAWRERCRKLRQAVDAINPSFQFCIYPAPGTLLMTEAAFLEWTTPAAPAIWADPSIYGRPAGLVPHEEALESNRQMLLDNMKVARSKHVPFMYAGGLDPVVRGADPEFCGRNAAMSAAATDGYWVFYEGPTYETTHPEYFRWFGRANRAIVKGTEARWAFQKRQTPDPGDAASFKKQTTLPQVGVFDTRELLRQTIGADPRFEVHDLLGMSPDYLRNFNAVILQNYNLAQKYDSPFVKTLRAYVEQGGSVMLAHDTAWFMDSPFPEIATRGFPKHNVEAERHVVDSELKVVREHAALNGLTVGTQFPTEFRDHMIFKAGPKGVTVITNTFGDPVYVLGEYGKGRVAFVGPYMGYKKALSGAEKQALLGVVAWLAKQ